MNIANVLLAAGCSSRLGQAKQLVPYSVGKNTDNLLTRQNRLIIQTGFPCYCVLGYQADVMSNFVLTSQVIFNHQWQQGMASSIVAAISQMPADVDAVLLLTVDQWQLTLHDLEQLIAHYRQQPFAIIATRYGKSLNDECDAFGPPVIFPKKYFKRLLQLTGQQGAKPVILANKEQVVFVDLANAEQDLDTQEQLQLMQAVNNEAQVNSQANIQINTKVNN